MPRFKYTVVTSDGKKLNGTIESPSENVARQDLNGLGFSIIGIQQIEEATKTQQDGNIIFEFEAYDKKGKKIVGTIPATDKYQAFKRLFNEYEFTVTAIYKGAASSYEKLQEKQAGIADLQQQLQREISLAKSKNNETTIEPISKDESAFQDEEKLNLQNQINLVLQKIQTLNTNYSKQISVEDQHSIDTKLNKLLRIRNSTNLNYVRESCADLLKTLQDLEVLMLNKDNDLQKSQLRFDISRMLTEIHKNTVRKSRREKLITKVELWIEKNPLEPEANFWQKYIFEIAQSILNFLKESEEIRELRQKKFLVLDQVQEYLKMYIKEKDTEIKQQIKANINSLRAKNKEVKQQIITLKKVEKQRRMAGLPENFAQSFLDEINTFSGWLLAMYLIYYFIAIYLNTKNFGFNPQNMPVSFLLYQSTFFKYILAMLFLFHSSVAIKSHFFRNNFLSTIIIFPSFVVVTTIIMLNL